LGAWETSDLKPKAIKDAWANGISEKRSSRLASPEIEAALPRLEVG